MENMLTNRKGFPRFASARFKYDTDAEYKKSETSCDINTNFKLFRHQKMVAEGKGGLNHMCFEVENIDEALAELKAKGIPLLDQVPRYGHAGCRIAFIDPSATENCLIELAELPKGGAAH